MVIFRSSLSLHILQSYGCTLAAWPHPLAMKRGDLQDHQKIIEILMIDVIIYTMWGYPQL